jgi:hypothetical protein
VTNKKEVGKHEKRRNDTAHQRALTNPEVLAALKTLRASWSDLSPRQRVEKVNVLIGLKCSMRGIAEELGKKESSFRRYIRQANPAEASDDWASMLESTLAKKPQKQSTKIPGEDVRRIPSKLPAKAIVGVTTKETHPMRHDARLSTAQQTKRITSQASTAAKTPPTVDGGSSGQKNQATEDTPRMSLPDQYILTRGPITLEKIQRLDAMSKQMERRPVQGAGTLTRQGRPLPPTD